VQLVEPAILSFLLLDVFADSLLVSAYRGYEVSSGPKIVASEVLSLPKEAPCDVYGALPFDETCHLRNAVLGRYADEHVDMVHQQVTFHYFALPLYRKLFEDLAQMLSKLFM
jgi:hypothetical protein